LCVSRPEPRGDDRQRRVARGLEQLCAEMPLVELTSRQVEPLSDLLEQMQGVVKDLREFHAR
jgi:hypothetical protein